MASLEVHSNRGWCVRATAHSVTPIREVGCSAKRLSQKPDLPMYQVRLSEGLASIRPMARLMVRRLEPHRLLAPAGTLLDELLWQTFDGIGPQGATVTTRVSADRGRAWNDHHS